MLLWVDTETTGLDPTKDRLLELGAIVTTDALEELARWSCVIYDPTAVDIMDDFVRDMHGKSRLLDEVARFDGPAIFLTGAIRLFREFLDRVDVPGHTPMAGSSVHFDREIIRHNMGAHVLDWFHYRNVDISTVYELAKRWCPEDTVYEPVKRNLHRVMPDLEDTLDLARFYRDRIFVVEGD